MASEVSNEIMRAAYMLVPVQEFCKSLKRRQKDAANEPGSIDAGNLNEEKMLKLQAAWINIASL